MLQQRDLPLKISLSLNACEWVKNAKQNAWFRCFPTEDVVVVEWWEKMLAVAALTHDRLVVDRTLIALRISTNLKTSQLFCWKCPLPIKTSSSIRKQLVKVLSCILFINFFMKCLSLMVNLIVVNNSTFIEVHFKLLQIRI